LLRLYSVDGRGMIGGMTLTDEICSSDTLSTTNPARQCYSCIIFQLYFVRQIFQQWPDPRRWRGGVACNGGELEICKALLDQHEENWPLTGTMWVSGQDSNLCTWQWTFGLHKGGAMLWRAERLVDSQKLGSVGFKLFGDYLRWRCKEARGGGVSFYCVSMNTTSTRGQATMGGLVAWGLGGCEKKCHCKK